MARPRAATYDDQRSRILVEAAALFAQRGYTAATMNDVAAACAVSKAALYHYFADKHDLLAHIAFEHVARLESLVQEVTREQAEPAPRLDALIRRFTAAYANAQNEHRVLTEDVKFLREDERQRIATAQKRVVAGFAQPIAQLRPDLATHATALAMLLFGMINWTFTWLKPGGNLTHAQIAPMVSQLFFGGLPAAVVPAKRADQAKAAKPAGPPDKRRIRRA
jgi:AcrR family transcriptional regulator